jgi:hypothetical protein
MFVAFLDPRVDDGGYDTVYDILYLSIRLHTYIITMYHFTLTCAIGSAAYTHKRVYAI